MPRRTEAAAANAERAATEKSKRIMRKIEDEEIKIEAALSLATIDTARDSHNAVSNEARRGQRTPVALLG